MGYRDIYELASLKGARQKCDYIKAHSSDEWFKKFLYYAFNPLITYQISDKFIDKFRKGEIEINPDTKLVFFDDIFSCCEYLSRLRAVDSVAQKQVAFMLTGFQEDERNLYLKLLSKNIRLGITSKTINKVIPDLIPEWEVQQAYPIETTTLGEDTYFWLTQKLNGARATLYNGQLIARSGTPYNGLEHITQILKPIWDEGYITDGELLLKDRGDLTDDEAFRKSTGILNSNDEYKTAISYTIFDIIPRSDFESDNPKVLYSQRRSLLNSFKSRLEDDNGYVKVLPTLYCGTDHAQISKLLDKMVAEDKEGLMLNTNVPYKRTRHKGILKVKKFYTMDLEIVGFEEGTGRLQGMLGAFIVKFKDNIVKVGSGILDEQRRQFWDSREELFGSLCEVKYKEISKDKKTGLESLQFPIFVRLRKDKTNVSYG